MTNHRALYLRSFPSLSIPHLPPPSLLNDSSSDSLKGIDKFSRPSSSLFGRWYTVGTAQQMTTKESFWKLGGEGFFASALELLVVF